MLVMLIVEQKVLILLLVELNQALLKDYLN